VTHKPTGGTYKTFGHRETVAMRLERQSPEETAQRIEAARPPAPLFRPEGRRAGRPRSTFEPPDEGGGQSEILEDFDELG